ncbi:hypothetical protein KSP40_PGU001890 [Platanthera guangdongensis]|uniref:Transmembrane protein n=1 Tax=Platanthera guangdongensis TaxID=2320717 RepID=A0ABR2N5E7_9ASPA
MTEVYDNTKAEMDDCSSVEVDDDLAGMLDEGSAELRLMRRATNEGNQKKRQKIPKKRLRKKKQTWHMKRVSRLAIIFVMLRGILVQKWNSQMATVAGGKSGSIPGNEKVISCVAELYFFFLSLLSPFLSSAIYSPTPSPFPANRPHKRTFADPAGLPMHAPPIFLNNLQFPPPPPHLCRRRHPQSPPPLGKLNLGKKVGLLFVAIAAVLQVTFASFLIYRRRQLKKMGRRYVMRVSS